jgi:hypothetical protein
LLRPTAGIEHQFFSPYNPHKYVVVERKKPNGPWLEKSSRGDKPSNNNMNNSVSGERWLWPTSSGHC